MAHAQCHDDPYSPVDKIVPVSPNPLPGNTVTHWVPGDICHHREEVLGQNQRLVLTVP